MILDRIANAASYRKLSPRIAAALDYLDGTDFDNTEAGRHTLDGDNLFAMVQQYKTRPMSEIIWESHRKYIDVQYVHSGREWMGVIDRTAEGCTVSTEYDAGKDAAFYDAKGDLLNLAAGQFIILAPDDVHAPGLAAGEPAKVTKVVVKVAVDPNAGPCGF